MSWVKKLSRTISSANKADDPLTQFHKTWQGVQTTFGESPSTSRVTVELASKLDHLLSLLVSEASSAISGSPQPNHTSTGPCFEYLLKNDLLSTLVSLSSSDDPLGSLRLTVKLFSDLIAAMHDTFLAHANVHKALLKLLRACVLPEGDLVGSSASYELDLVDLMATVSARIKAYPDLLPIFFRPVSPLPFERVGSPTPSQSSSHAGTVTSDQVSLSRQAEFLLFSFLLRFVHTEGQTGDLARLGLLKLIQVAFSGSSSSNIPPPQPPNKGDRARADQVIIDLSARHARTSSGSAASKSHEATLLLAEWLLDSDFAEVLGAGLGALYGLLPSKLTGELYSLQGQEVVFTGDFVDEEQETPTGTGTVRRMRSLGMGELDSEDTTAQRVTFLSLLDFTQEVLERSTSSFIADREKQLIAANLRDNILSSVKSIFLDAVLYPSIMECTEADGSSLAVLTYLTDMLDTSHRDGELAQAVLNYLVGNGGTTSPKKPTDRKSKLKTRKSSAMMLIESSNPSMDAKRSYLQSADSFNLRDILLQNLEPKLKGSKQHQVTQAAALRLLDMLISKHDSFSSPVLNAISKSDATNFPPKTEEDDSAASDSDDEEVFVYPSTATGPSDDPTPANRLVKAVQSIERYVALAQSLQSTASPDTDYQRHMVQATKLITSQPSFQRAMSNPQPVTGSMLRPHSSALTRLLLRHVAAFFTHAPAFNLALTSCLSSLAACPTRSLEGWMVGDQGSVMNLYEQLAHSLQSLRQSGEVQDFGRMLEERRKGFELVDNLADALLEDALDDPGVSIAPSAQTASSTSNTDMSAPTHPFAAHYAKTAQIKVMPPVATLQSHASPAYDFGDEESSSSDEDDGQYAAQRKDKDGPRMVSLSMLLDNMSIFEESLKEITAIIQVRKTCSIDAF